MACFENYTTVAFYALLMAPKNTERLCTLHLYISSRVSRYD